MLTHSGLVPVGNSVEEVVVATSPTNSISPSASPRSSSFLPASPSTWRVKLSQEKCPPATSRLLVLSADPGKTCGLVASRAKRSSPRLDSSLLARRAAAPSPNTMLEIAGYRVKDTVASEFFQVPVN